MNSGTWQLGRWDVLPEPVGQLLEGALAAAVAQHCAGRNAVVCKQVKEEKRCQVKEEKHMIECNHIQINKYILIIGTF